MEISIVCDSSPVSSQCGFPIYNIFSKTDEVFEKQVDAANEGEEGTRNCEMHLLPSFRAPCKVFWMFTDELKK